MDYRRKLQKEKKKTTTITSSLSTQVTFFNPIAKSG
jgi:hypothetical protein